LSDEPVRARPDSVAYVVRTRSRAATKKHPVVSVILASVAALLLAEFGGSRLDRRFNITPSFERLVIARFSRFVAPALPNVRLIVVQDETDLPGLARSVGVDPIPPGPRNWLRAVRGKLLSKLAESGARVVALDYYWIDGTETRFDEAVIRGARELGERGIPTVIGVATWVPRPNARPLLYPPFAQVMRTGCLAAWTKPTAPWYVQLAVCPTGGDVLPSLSLSAYAAACQPREPPKFEIDGGLDFVEVHYAGQTGQSEQIDVTRVESQGDDDKTVQLSKGSVIAKYFIAVPPDEVLSSSTVDIGAALSFDGAAMRRQFAGKAIIIADQRSDRPDQHQYVDGRTIFGAAAQAVALDALMAKRPILGPRLLDLAGLYLDGQVLLDAILVVVAALVGWFALRARWRFVIIPLGLAIVVGACIAGYWRLGWLYSPWIPCLGFLISFELSRLIHRISSRHI
ncbi:MAG: CHASE2 domain-containing protein, partial [Tepidisphaeraceae bacterium]